jgi:hypothetical protein
MTKWAKMGKNGYRVRIGYKWVRLDIGHVRNKNITITPEILKLIAEIDEFKGCGSPKYRSAFKSKSWQIHPTSFVPV